jgi:integrase/recombinase XerD
MDDSIQISEGRTKTEVPVLTKIPKEVADMLRLTPNDHAGYFFWNPDTQTESAIRQKYLDMMRKAFDKAGITRDKKNGGMTLSHRLRDTFAVEYLIASGRLEDLSKLLGHKSLVTTEKHYGAWVPERKERLLKTAEDILSKQEPVGLGRPTAGKSAKTN